MNIPGNDKDLLTKKGGERFGGLRNIRNFTKTS
jgi:hypothetical protein